MADGLLNKASIILTPTGYKAGTLYNVAPVVEPYEDFDFARASVASRVNSSGLVEMVGRTLGSELVVNGDFATDSDWILENGAEINNGSVNIIGVGSRFRQDVLIVGKTYKLDYQVVSTNGASFRFQDGVTAYADINQAVGYHTYYFEATGVRVQFQALGDINARIDNVSVKEIIDTNNIPRISYDSNGDNGHILLEPTSTNLVTYSEDFSLWSLYNYGGASLNLTSGYLAPDGSANGYEFDFTQSSGGSLITLNTTATASADHSLSIWLKGKVGGEKVKIDFKNTGSSGVSGELFTLTTDWVRYDVTVTNDTGTSRGFQIRLTNSDSIGTETFYAWGAQLEELPYATSYIPTLTGSTETRATETATGAGSAALINSTEGVLYAEIAALDDSTTTTIFSLSNGTNANTLYMGFSSTSNTIQAQLVVGNVGQTNMNYVVADRTQFNKVAVLYQNNNHKMYINGSEVAVDTSGSVPSANTFDRLNFDLGQGSFDFYGKCKALAVFNEALSDSELTQLTT